MGGPIICHDGRLVQTRVGEFMAIRHCRLRPDGMSACGTPVRG